MPIFQSIYNTPDFYTNINLYTYPFLTKKAKTKKTTLLVLKNQLAKHKDELCVVLFCLAWS